MKLNQFGFTSAARQARNNQWAHDCNFNNDYYGDQLCTENTQALRCSDSETQPARLREYPLYTVLMSAAFVAGMVVALYLFLG